MIPGGYRVYDQNDFIMWVTPSLIWEISGAFVCHIDAVTRTVNLL